MELVADRSRIDRCCNIVSFLCYMIWVENGRCGGEVVKFNAVSWLSEVDHTLVTIAGQGCEVGWPYRTHRNERRQWSVRSCSSPYPGFPHSLALETSCHQQNTVHDIQRQYRQPAVCVNDLTPGLCRSWVRVWEVRRGRTTTTRSALQAPAALGLVYSKLLFFRGTQASQVLVFFPWCEKEYVLPQDIVATVQQHYHDHDTTGLSTL